MPNSYDAIRTSVVSSGIDSRVEVNQRALIDKILARYASAGAVYRELIQNSNDAEANTAQIRFTTKETPAGQVVTQVVYRNDGHPFRPQDWQRLRKIAEGNPDVSKVGAFGVGAYTMFSICEEPLVVSGNEALAFAWKGDALWTKTGPSPHTPDQWTTFVLPSRDPYPFPNLVEFGQFLCTSLTFTQCLHTIIVFVDEKERITISKRQLQPPTVMTPPKASSWWSNDGAVTHSPKRIFSLGRADGSITETIIEMTAMLDGEVSSITARYVSALANVRVPHDMAKHMFRVTKKNPPTEVNIQIFIDAAAKRIKRNRSRAEAITDKFSPGMGNGGIFIGFKTSQTTGLAAHLAAPLIPTVEREAIDFQDPNLRVFNSELLCIAGILMRLTLEHSMSLIGKRWDQTKEERMALDKKLRNGASPTNDSKTEKALEDGHDLGQKADSQGSKSKSALFGFASFMSSGVRKIADVISSVDFRGNDDENLLNPPDPRPLSKEEEEAIMLMCSFCPQQSTPDPRVGSLMAKGFSTCMPNVSPPVLTSSGVVRSSESRLPFQGIERFVTEGVVRRVVQQSADTYLRYVAGCDLLSLSDLEHALLKRPLTEEEFIIFLKWWTKFCRTETEAIKRGPAIKTKVSFTKMDVKTENKAETRDSFTSLTTIRYYRDEKVFSSDLPMPATVLPRSIQDNVPQGVLGDKSLSSWFIPLPLSVWSSFIATHPCLTAGRHIDSDIRLLALSTLSREHSSRSGQSLATYERWLQESLSNIRCIPYHSYAPTPQATDFPRDLYLSSAEIAVFEGLGSFKKVSPALQKAEVSDEFLVAVGVRKAISIDFLFTQLDNLKWSGDPKPLIAYLCKATLTTQDLDKLKTTKYLPARGDKSTAYAPSELHLPNPQLGLFPFLKILHWPSMDEVTERSQEGRFLMQLGCRADPDLKTVLNHLTHDTVEDITRLKILSFISERLRPGGSYEREYSSALAGQSAMRLMKFLPSIRKDPLTPEAPRKELQAPTQCYTDSEVLCMGFSVLDPVLQRKEGKAVGERFSCNLRPTADRLVYQLLNVASFAKTKLARIEESDKEFSDVVVASFSNIFDYLSTRTRDLSKAMVQTLREAPFIPCKEEDKLRWLRPSEVYFKNANSDTAELTSTLFSVTDFNPFLATVGVQSEPSVKHLFHLVMSSPSQVLKKIGGEVKYRALLRRIAANPPYTKVTAEMRNASFLLAYRMEEEGERQKATKEDESNAEVRKFVLARAREICVIDNSFFARMFNVLSAPPESDLESFYVSMGSEYISKRVQQRFQYDGTALQNTTLTTEFTSRIQERKPLLASPSVTSRKLKSNAAALLEENNLHVYEVREAKAIYSLDNMSRAQDITCFSSEGRNGNGSVYIVQNFDWFDVGGAIGKLILQRCHLEDSFFIGSLLEAPLKQLRARGFPVDRILKRTEPAELPVEGQKDANAGSISKENGGSNYGDISPESQGATASPGGSEPDGFINILRQMFPDCDQKHIQSLLGKTPTLETLRQVADSLADGNYPKQSSPEQQQNPNTPAKSLSTPSSTEPTGPAQGVNQTRKAHKPGGTSVQQGGRFNPLTRALRGIRSTSVTGSRLFPSVGKTLLQEETSRRNEPVSPSQDAAGQKRLEKLLRDSVRSSRKVPSAGISSQETMLTSIPEDLERSGDNCEVIPGHCLKPCLGRHQTGKTGNGIRVFSSRRDKNSDPYLNSNFDMVEAFSGILQTLCEVYSLRLHSVAIFHEAAGNTIAFNSGSALHFNLRYFVSLHWKDKLDEACYSYWFTVMAHELAHNFVSPHNKDHGYFTQSYVILFLPKLLEVLRQ